MNWNESPYSNITKKVDGEPPTNLSAKRGAWTSITKGSIGGNCLSKENITRMWDTI